MDIIFREKYVNYNQICDVSLVEIYELLSNNNIELDLGDDFSNDWAGYSYYYCKKLNELDERTISSFVYIITWFMTGNPIEINPNFKSNVYYKNDKILDKCLKIYDEIFYKYDSEVEICDALFKEIYHLYVENHKNYVKKSERLNCLLTYEHMELFDKLPCNSRSEKLELLLRNYYNF